MAALTPRQFADLYAHRVTIAKLLAPWFARRTVADLATAFAGTSVAWAQLHNHAAAPEACRASRPVSG